MPWFAPPFLITRTKLLSLWLTSIMTTLTTLTLLQVVDIPSKIFVGHQNIVRPAPILTAAVSTITASPASTEKNPTEYTNNHAYHTRCLNQTIDDRSRSSTHRRSLQDREYAAGDDERTLYESREHT